MKTIKIGILYNDNKLKLTNDHYLYYKYEQIKNLCNTYNIKFVEDCTKEIADVIIFSQYDINFDDIKYNKEFQYNIELRNEKIKQKINVFLSKALGNPIYLLFWGEYNNWPFEHTHLLSTFDIFKDYKNIYTLSFNDDSDNNLFYPLVCSTFYDIYENLKNKKIYAKDDLLEKNKFSAYISSNINNIKEHIFNLISNNITTVDHYGSWKFNKQKNTNLELKEEDVKNKLINYKFILCLENTYSTNNPSYITEKISKGFINNCVPIYFGSTNINNIFNSKSFINITDLNDDEILNIINYYNTNDDAYLNMLNEYPFKNKDINYIEHYDNKLKKFMINNIFSKIENKTNDVVIWCSYHNDTYIDEYNLDYVPDYIKLFNSNDVEINGNNINYLNPYLCELVTYYYVWKNQIYSEYVGFCHYRRFFKKISIDNLKKYGVHYFGSINVCIKNMAQKSNQFYDDKYNNLLYTYLKSLNIFDEKLLYEYFYTEKIINLPLKISYVFEWNLFNKFCEIIFGFLEYILPNYKDINIYTTIGRKYAWLFEIVCGIVLSLLINNVTLEDTNWTIFSDKALLSKSEDANKIKLFVRKNNRTNTNIYILSNNKDELINKLGYEENLSVINNVSEIKNFDQNNILELDINQYIKCKEFNDFKLNNYIIENIK